MLIAAVAAVVAYRQFRANQDTRDDQSRPYVIADFESSQAGMVLSDFVVRNIGKTPALDVQIRLTPPPARANETTSFPLSKARLINGTLPMGKYSEFPSAGWSAGVIGGRVGAA